METLSYLQLFSSHVYCQVSLVRRMTRYILTIERHHVILSYQYEYILNKILNKLISFFLPNNSKIHARAGLHASAFSPRFRTCQYHIIYIFIYFHSVDPYRITKSIWIWKLPYLLKKSRSEVSMKVSNNFSY
jgi:hypothetical protein